MDILNTLFDYQRFSRNARLEAHIGAAHARYLAGGTELCDEALELAAAGEPQPLEGGPGPDGAKDRRNG